MSEVSDAYWAQKQKAQLSFGPSSEGSPDDAQRAFELSKSSGVPAESIGADPTEFDKIYKAQLGQTLIQHNSYISDFINDHPLHGQLVSDDLPNLHALTKHVESIPLGDPFELAAQRVRESVTKRTAIGPATRMPEAMAAAIVGFPIWLTKAAHDLVEAARTGQLHQMLSEGTIDKETALNALNVAGAAAAGIRIGRPKGLELRDGEVLPPETPPPTPGGLPKPPPTIEGEAGPTDMSRRGFIKGVGAAAATAVAPKAAIDFVRPLHPMAEQYAADVWFDHVTATPTSSRAVAASNLRSIAKGFAEAPEGNPFMDATKGELATAYKDAAKLVESGWSPDKEQIGRIFGWNKIKPFVQAGERPPRGANEEFDKLIDDQSAETHKMLDKAIDLSEQTALKERLPEKLQELLDKVPGSRVRLTLDGIRGLYGNVVPHPEDGMLGWIPNLDGRLQEMYPGGSISIPTSQFLSYTPKEVYKAISDDVALGDSYTPNEIKGFAQVEEPEKIKSAAVRVGDQVHEGAAHFEAMEKAEKAGPIEGMEEGFTTSLGRFVDRAEANAIAEQARQLTSRGEARQKGEAERTGGTQLISEDLVTIGPKSEAAQIGQWVEHDLVMKDRPPEEAKALGALAAARYYARGIRLGVSPLDLFASENIEFKRGGAGDEPGFDQLLRGKTSFYSDRRVITFFDRADASTGIHEFGHLWLDELFRDAMRPGAPTSLVADRDIILEALGYGPGEIVDSLHLKTEDHEKFASAFEHYIGTGESPSRGLTAIFEKLKAWLLEIYNVIGEFGGKISPAMRGVFDRMLATDEEIRVRTGGDQAALDAIREEAGLNLNIVGYPGVEDLPYMHVGFLDQMIKEGAPWQSYNENPFLKAFMDFQNQMVPTATKEQAADPAWRANRTYIVDGKEYKGDAVIPALIEKTKELAGGVVDNNRVLTLVTGPPAAGKSTIITPMAKALKAAYISADDIKHAIPENQGGIGNQAVHAEGVALANVVLDRLSARGTNIIHEKLGYQVDDLVNGIFHLARERGYSINLIHVHAPIEEIVPRMVKRFMATGRVIDPAKLAEVVDKTYPAYQELKKYADRSAAFDTKGPVPTLVDGDKEIASIVGAGEGGPGEPDASGLLLQAAQQAPQEGVNDNKTPTQQFIEEYDKLVSDKAAEERRKELYVVPKSFGQPVFDKGAAFGRTNRELMRYERLIRERDGRDIEWRRARAQKQAELENKAEWKAEAARVRPEVQEEVMSRPEVRAYSTIEAGNVKIERSAVPVGIDLPSKFMKKGGIHPDDLADWFKFQTGDELLHVLSIMYRATQGYRGDIVKRLTDYEVYNRVKEKLGETQEERLAEVEDHALAITDMEKLHEQMLIIGQRAGAAIPLTKNQIQWGAHFDLMEQPFGNMDRKLFIREANKAGRMVERNLLEGNPNEAFRWAQAQYKYTLQAKEMEGIEKEIRAFEKEAKRFRAREVERVPQEYTNQIRYILERIDYPVGDPEDLARELEAGKQTLEQFHVRKWSDGIELPIPDFLLDPNFRKPLEEMNVRDARQTMNAVRSMARAGRRENQIIKGGERKDLLELLEQMYEQLEKLGEAKELVWNGASLIRKSARTYLASTLTIETILNRFDHGDAFGLFNQYVGRGLIDAASAEARLDQEVAKAYNDLPWPKESMHKRVYNPIFRRPLQGKDGQMDWDNAPLLKFTRQNLLSVLLNAGNPDNLERLATGYGLKPEEVMRWLEANTTKADWDWAQAHGNIYAGLKTKSDMMRRRISGIAPESVPLPGVQVYLDGVVHSYPGWYNPVIHDEVFSGRIDLKDVDGLFTKGYIRAGTPAGYTKARTSYRGPLSLSLSGIAGRLYQEIHDISFREAVIEANKIINSPDGRFKNMITRFYGKEYSSLFDPWLRDIAGNSNLSTDIGQAGEMLFEFFRQNMIGTLVGANPRTIQKHTITALGTSINEVGSKNYMEAALSLFARDETSMESNWKFALKKFDEVARRHRNFREQVKGATEANLAIAGPMHPFLKFRQLMTYYGSYPVGVLDQGLSAITALAAYRKALDLGLSEGDSIFYANRAVRRSHGSTAITNLPAAMRGGELMRSFTTLYNFGNAFGNRQYEMAWRAKEEAGEATPEETHEGLDQMRKPNGLWLGLFFFVLVPSFVEEWVSPHEGHDKESYGVWAAKVLTRGLSFGWYGARDIIGAITEGREPTVGMTDIPVRDMANLVRDLHKQGLGMTKDDAGKTIRDSFIALGIATGLTNAEMGNIAEYLHDVQTGKIRPKTPGDWYEGLTKGKNTPPWKEQKPDLIEKGLRLFEGGRR